MLRECLQCADPDQLNAALDPDVKADYLGCLFHRLPTLPQNLKISGFSSMYTVNQDDVHPMIGETNRPRKLTTGGPGIKYNTIHGLRTKIRVLFVL